MILVVDEAFGADKLFLLARVADKLDQFVVLCAISKVQEDFFLFNWWAIHFIIIKYYKVKSKNQCYNFKFVLDSKG